MKIKKDYREVRCDEREITHGTHGEREKEEKDRKQDK